VWPRGINAISRSSTIGRSFRGGERRAGRDFFEGLVDKLVVGASVRDMQAFDDALSGFGMSKLRDGYASYFVKLNVGRSSAARRSARWCTATGSRRA
jgi:hypothetical protein